MSPSQISQYCEETSILWVRRDSMALQSDVRLEDLCKIDRRLDAHLDGLQLAGEAAWPIVDSELRWNDSGEAFLAAALSFDIGVPSRINRYLERFSRTDDLVRGYVSGMGWRASEKMQNSTMEFLNSSSDCFRRVGVNVAAILRRDPGSPLAKMLQDSASQPRARALRAVGELGRAELLPQVQQQLASEDTACRVAAAWTVSLRMQDREATKVLRSCVTEEPPPDCDADRRSMLCRRRLRALQLAPRVMQPQDAQAWLHELANSQRFVRHAVVGSGVAGLPTAVPWLIEQMHVPELARVAGEALTMITGVDIAGEGLETEWPLGFHAGPTEDPDDENVEMDPDENLPWPDPEAVARWWHAQRGQFQPGVRYLAGKPITDDWLQQVLRQGYQRQRAAAALELAIRHPGEPLFEVRAPAWRQKQLLGLK